MSRLGTVAKFTLFLIIPIILLVSSIVFFVTENKRYTQAVGYWGEEMIGNDFWLHPRNKYMSLVSRDSVYMGEIVEVNFDAQHPESFELNLLSIQNPKEPRSFVVKLPNLVYEYGTKRDVRTILETGQESITPKIVETEYVVNKLVPGTKIIFTLTEPISREGQSYISFINILDRDD